MEMQCWHTAISLSMLNADDDTGFSDKATTNVIRQRQHLPGNLADTPLTTNALFRLLIVIPLHGTVSVFIKINTWRRYKLWLLLNVVTVVFIPHSFFQIWRQRRRTEEFNRKWVEPQDSKSTIYFNSVWNGVICDIYWHKSYWHK